MVIIVYSPKYIYGRTYILPYIFIYQVRRVPERKIYIYGYHQRIYKSIYQVGARKYIYLYITGFYISTYASMVGTISKICACRRACATQCDIRTFCRSQCVHFIFVIMHNNTLSSL